MADVPQEVYAHVVQLRRHGKALLCALRASSDDDAALARRLYTLLWHEWLHMGQELQQWLLTHTTVPPVTPLTTTTTAKTADDDNAQQQQDSSSDDDDSTCALPTRRHRRVAAVPLHGLLYLPDDAAVMLHTRTAVPPPPPLRHLSSRVAHDNDDNGSSNSSSTMAHDQPAVVAATVATAPLRRHLTYDDDDVTTTTRQRDCAAPSMMAHVRRSDVCVYVWPVCDGDSDAHKDGSIVTDDDEDGGTDIAPLRVRVTSGCHSVADVVAQAASSSSSSLRCVSATAVLYTPTGSRVQSLCELTDNSHYLAVPRNRPYRCDAVPTRLLRILVSTARAAQQQQQRQHKMTRHA